MPLIVFSSDIEGISADLTNANLVDTTNYTLQGVPRNTLAVYVFLFKRDAQNNDTSILIDYTNPSTALTALQWNFLLPPQDGLFVARFFGFPFWSPGTYSLNSAIYLVSSGAVYYCNNVAGTSQTPGVGVDWTIVPVANISSVIGGLAPTPPNVSQTQTYNFATSHIQTGVLADAEADLGLKIIDGHCKNWNDAAGVIIGGALIDSAYTNFAKQNYTTAQGIIDYLQATTVLPI